MATVNYQSHNTIDGTSQELLEDDCEGPESLCTTKPFKDPYSSDDEKVKLREGTRKDHYTDKVHIEDLNPLGVKLHEVEDSSKIQPAQVVYFLNVDFNPIAKHEDRADKETLGGSGNDSIEECLFQLFRFITHIYTPSNEKEFKYNDKSMKEIKDLYFEMNTIKWMYRNDCCDWKNTSSEQRKEKKLFFLEKFVQANKSPNSHAIGNICDLVLRSLDLYEELLTESDKKDKCRRTESIKKYFETMGAVTGTRNYIRNSECKMKFPLRVPTIDVPDGSTLIETRNSTILTNPDGVFKSAWPEKYKVMLEVYSPDDDYETSHHRSVSTAQSPVDMQVDATTNTDKNVPEKRRRCSQTLPSTLMINNESSRSDQKCIQRSSLPVNREVVSSTGRPPICVSQYTQRKGITSKNEFPIELPPMQFPVYKNACRPEKIPSILDTHYEEKARKFARQSIPASCHDSQCTNKMTGEHVIHLFGQAHKNSSNILSSYDLVDVGNSKLQREIGMFIVNEYVYFSRLDIDPGLMPYICGERYRGMKQLDIAITEQQVKECFKRPRVTYSHFRLDITKAYHRIALLIFVTELVQNLSLSGLGVFDEG